MQCMAPADQQVRDICVLLLFSLRSKARRQKPAG